MSDIADMTEIQRETLSLLTAADKNLYLDRLASRRRTETPAMQREIANAKQIYGTGWIVFWVIVFLPVAIFMMVVNKGTTPRWVVWATFGLIAINILFGVVSGGIL